MNLVHRSENTLLYHGDARRLTEIADGSVALVCTSPPYWNAREYAQWPTYEAYLADMALVWAECFRVLMNGGRIAVNVPHGYGRSNNGGYKRIGDHTATAMESAGFEIRGVVIWVKEGAVSGTTWGSWLSASNPALRDSHEIIVIGHKGKPSRGEGESTIDEQTFLDATRSVWRISAATSARSWHPAPFPAEIPRRLTELYTYAGDTVLDPFMGSGTTPFTAAKLGRIGVGVDLCREYIVRAAGPMFCVADGATAA